MSPAPGRVDALRLVTAGSLDPGEVLRVFNLGFSDYLLPMVMDEAGLADHIACNDIDLACSRVAVDAEPVAFTLVARRGTEAWIGGMGVAPAYRRGGLGARTLTATIEAVAAEGADAVWLEVLEDNAAALALYERLGFERVRHLEVWSLPPDPGRTATDRALNVDAAHAWVAAHRAGREPWQRADASIARMRERGAPFVGTVVRRSDQIVGAAICRPDATTVRVLQIAAVDEAAARDLILAAAGGLTLRLANLPGDDLLSEVLLRLGAERTVAQYEMRLDVR